jgi:hypothetical protein
MSSSTQNPLAGLSRTPFLAGAEVSWQWLQFFNKIALSSAVPVLQTGTHASRLASAPSTLASGSLFVETDRGVAYVAVSGQWFYFAGVSPTNQQNLPTDLGANDVNFLAYVQDYAHLLIWTGMGWTWAPAENGSGYIVAFISTPMPSTGWQACNGSSNVPTLDFDGTLSFVTVPNTPGSFYRQ